MEEGFLSSISMMYALHYTPHVLRRLRVFVRRDPSLQVRIDRTLRQLEHDPFHPGLRTHKVTRGNGERVFSSRVTGDMRLLWEFSDAHVLALTILDIGGHEGRRNVYR